MRRLSIIKSIILLLTLAGCSSNYTFTGSIISNDVKTFQVTMFQNKAEVVEPGIERTFTRKLQDLIQNQTKLSLTNKGGDLLYEGEITQFRITPMTATANQLAAQNRLTITVNVRFVNKNKEDDNFEKPFSFYYDYPGDELLTGSALTAALEEIFERITQDIFNASLAKW
ncbi:lipoprotein [Flavobacterium rivuli WB 3.3-2 = DSM 21788]|uniref:Lipoprotein n=1 Tax=Flavobacterium rivuli WB 3.3-2 = DSM 21788 TaxID=1121895 RepID=A0A0A2M168_9FLAO|nr:LptE family protein [Flavobacterium rivuli]KGO86019.1 lipoprotein [Flavobacterium rivuli WB 3.3-2 = DSM 21788]